MAAIVIGVVGFAILCLIVSVLTVGITRRTVEAFASGLLLYCSLPALAIAGGIAIGLGAEKSGPLEDAAVKITALGTIILVPTFIAVVIATAKAAFEQEIPEEAEPEADSLPPGVKDVESIGSSTPKSAVLNRADEHWVAMFFHLHGLSREQSVRLLDVYKGYNLIKRGSEEDRYEVTDPRCFEKSTVEKALRR